MDSDAWGLTIMYDITLIQKMKSLLSGYLFKLFLWSIDRSAENYWTEIFFQELNHRRKNFKNIYDYEQEIEMD
jgi:hypothetical protein